MGTLSPVPSPVRRVLLAVALVAFALSAATTITTPSSADTPTGADAGPSGDRLGAVDRRSSSPLTVDATAPRAVDQTTHERSRGRWTATLLGAFLAAVVGLAGLRRAVTPPSVERRPANRLAAALLGRAPPLTA